MSQVNVAAEFPKNNNSVISEQDSNFDNFVHSEQEVMSTWKKGQPIIKYFQFD